MDAYYNGIADGYNELHGEEQRKKLNLIAKHVEIIENMKMLDVGCGTGIVQEYFKCESIGIDPSEGLLKQNSHKCMLGRAENLPFGDNEFDVVISLTCIQNFDNIEKGISEIRRVGKKLFILSFLKNSPRRTEIERIILGKFTVEKKLDEEKDIIFILK